jgi:hypothetical protein
MLPPFIIEQIRKREEESLRRDADRPRVELPVDYRPTPRKQPVEDEEDQDRGCVILDLGLAQHRNPSFFFRAPGPAGPRGALPYGATTFLLFFRCRATTLRAS